MRGQGESALPGAWSALTQFFGREDESEDVAQQLRHAHLVTMVGAPGAGKTRLAVEVAEQVAATFRDGVRPVALAPVSGPDNVVAATAVALGVLDEPGTHLEDSLLDALASAELLVLVDNCEHVVGRVAELVGRILHSCPGVRVLATSRVPLAVPGEQLFRVPSLGRRTATELFVDRAGLVTELVLDEAAEEYVDRICSQLDGLPLAIELAAGQARAFSLQEILARLDTELAHVEVPGSTAGGRRTMAATIAWSARLLTVAQNEMLDRLSVFAGRFDLPAVEAVAAPDAQVSADLTALVDHSLLLAEPGKSGSMGYHLLEPVRQFAAARLDRRSDADAIRALHATHYLDVVRRADKGVIRGDGQQRFAELRRAEGNALAAVAWARGACSDLGLQLVTHLGQFWQHRGYVNEAWERVEGLLERGTPSPRSRGEALVALSDFGYRQGRYAEAQDQAREAAAIFGRLDDDDGVGRALAVLGQSAASGGDPALGVASCEQGVEIFRARGDVHAQAWASILLGGTYYAALRNDRAAEAFRTALALLDTVASTPTLRPRAYIGLSLALALDHDVAGHRRLLEATIADLRETGMLGDYEWVWSALFLAHSEGRMKASLRLAGVAGKLSRQGNQAPPSAKTICMRAIADAEAHVGPEAAQRLKERGTSMSSEEAAAEALALPVDDATPLSSRELEIARLTGQGLKNSEIADQLFISRRTVESHQEHIREKLQLTSRYEVMAWVLGEESV